MIKRFAAAALLALLALFGATEFASAQFVMPGERARGPSLHALGGDIRVGTNVFKTVTPKSLYDAGAPVALTDAATIAVDLTASLNFTVTINGNRTLGNPSAGMTAGKSGVIRVIQGAGGNFTLAYSSNWKFPGGVLVLSTSAAAVDVISYFVYDSATIYATVSRGFQ